MKNAENKNATLTGFADWIKEKGKSENTVKTYLGVLKQLQLWLNQQHKDLSNLQQSDIQRYMDYLEENNRSASTIDKVFATIRVFSQYKNNDDIIKNIVKKEKEKHTYQTLPESLTKHEKDKLLKSVKADGNKRNIAIVYTLLYTGIRISELCELNVSDIVLNKSKKTLTVTSNNQNKSRVIPLVADVAKALENYLADREEEDGPLFLSNFNKRMTTRTVQYMLNKYNVNPHKLRHTFCQDLINKGYDLLVVAQMAGHNDINVTKRYVKYMKENVENGESLA